MHDKVTNNILDAKIKQKKLVNQSDVSRFINNSDLDGKIKTLTKKAGLKEEQGKMFCGESFFDNDGKQTFFIFQHLSDTEKVVSWKS